MRIVVDYTKDENPNTIQVVSAEYLGNYVVRVQFNDGSEKLVDFKIFLSNSTNPSIRKYLDEEKFSKFKITDGNLNWNDYDMIFPVSDLYKGEIN